MGWDQSGGVRMKAEQLGRSVGGSCPVERETPEGTRCPLEVVFDERLAKNHPWGAHQIWRWEIGLCCFTGELSHLFYGTDGFSQKTCSFMHRANRGLRRCLPAAE